MLILTASLAAQDTRGQIVGRVRDATDAVVPGAQVRARNAATNVSTSAQTNQTGDYLIPYLAPGTYTLTVSREGFSGFVREEIPIRIGDRVTVDVTLHPGSVAESVTVEAKAPLLEQATASLGQVIDTRRISELPLREGNPMLLANTVPGVLNFSGAASTDPSSVSGSSAFATSGTRSANNDMTLDGVANTARNTVAYVPPVDVVEEFRIQTASFDASQGFTPGSVVNVTLKSGTNQFHGSAYEFLQNDKLNANRFFSNMAGQKRPPLHFNRWGINGTGPVFIPKFYDGRNRTFWMFGYEDSRSRQLRGTYTNTVPTAAERTGDFSALLRVGLQYQLYDPVSTRPAPNNRFQRSPFPGNILPVSRLDPIAQKIAQFWYSPNVPGTIDGSLNYTDPGPEKVDYGSELFRVDHNISDRHRFFVRGNVGKRDQQYDTRFQEAQGAFFHRFMRGIAFDDVFTFTPSILLNVRYGYARFIEQNIPLQDKFDLSSLGFAPNFISEVGQGPAGSVKLPYLNITGYAPFGNQTLSSRADDSHTAGGTITHVVRSHMMRYGVEYRVYRENTYQLGQSSGQLDFGTTYSNGPLDSAAPSPKGGGLANFLLGIPTGGAIASNDSYAYQNTELGLFIQDDWKVTNRLTVSPGLRYELPGPLTERFNRSVGGFDFSSPSPIDAAARAKYATRPIPEVPVSRFQAIGGLTFPGVDGRPRELTKRDRNNFAPRIGFAFSLDPHTVLRGGYGIFYDQLGTSRLPFIQTGFSRTTSLVSSSDNGQTYIASIANPFPSGFQHADGATAGLATNLGQSVTFYNPGLVNPYMQRWQLSVQRELFPNTMLEVAYVGNRGTKIRASRQANPIPREYLSTSPVRDQPTIDYLSAATPNPFYPLLPGTGLSGINTTRAQLLRPYPQFTGISFDDQQGYSWYHSIQTRLEKRFSQGYTVNVSWTWSKFMEATGFLNETDPQPEKVISDQDRTHRVVITGVYELPFGRGRQWGSGWHPVLNGVLGGWQLSNVYQYQSGPALGFGNAIFTGNLADIPLSSGKRARTRWFNTAAGFETNSLKQLSSNLRTFSSRFNGIRGDSMNNWDLSMVKAFPITEQVTLHFRSEFINAFNHVMFGDPNTNPASTAFGVITSEVSKPRTIQFALRLVW
ncbi:MAG: TonB-dependent receptor [Bryobacterales bacterium]|nr:TonB-dependent receptor [Bryobacterales bacterium]